MQGRQDKMEYQALHKLARRKGYTPTADNASNARTTGMHINSRPPTLSEDNQSRKQNAML